MATSIINIPCYIQGQGNLNVGNCDLILGEELGYITVPAGTVFPLTAIPTLKATIAAMVHADAAYDRAQILYNKFKGSEAANIDAQTGNWPNGDPYQTKDERRGRTFTFEGNICLWKAVSAMDGKHDTTEVIEVFKTSQGNACIFTPATTADGKPGIKGFSLAQIKSTQLSEILNNAAGQFTQTIVHSIPQEWRDMVAVIPGDGDIISTVKGIETVTLSQVLNSPQVAGTYQIAAATGCGRKNLAAGEFATDLLNVANWTCKNQLGNAVTIDGVTRNGVPNFSFALLASDPDYTAGTTFYFSLAAPSVLSANDIEWLESNVLAVPK